MPRSLPGLFCGWACLSLAVLWAQEPPAVEQTLGEVRIEGHSIKNLTLIKQGDVTDPRDAQGALLGQRLERPAAQLRLAPGKYRVQHVELEGGVESRDLAGLEEEWFEVAPDKPHRLVIGAPLTPHVNASRHGRFLEMEYQLVDGAGRNYTQVLDYENPAAPEFPAPRFSVRKNGELLGSEAFQYG